MQLAKVIGNATATVKHPSLKGWKLMVAQPLAANGDPEDFPLIMVDPLGAGKDDTIMFTSDGKFVRDLLADDSTPVRFAVIGIAD
jgi:ethanolamine utilization protein EutN